MKLTEESKEEQQNQDRLSIIPAQAKSFQLNLPAHETEVRGISRFHQWLKHLYHYRT
jgi:hypothetical protein